METVQFIGQQVIKILLVLLQAYSYVILIRIILSFFTSPTSSVVQFLIFLTEPILAPIRKMLEPLTSKTRLPLDFSPLIAFMLISIVSELLRQWFL